MYKEQFCVGDISSIVVKLKFNVEEPVIRFVEGPAIEIEGTMPS